MPSATRNRWPCSQPIWVLGCERLDSSTRKVLISSAITKWSSFFSRTRPRSVIPKLRARSGAPLPFGEGTLGWSGLALIRVAEFVMPFSRGVRLAKEFLTIGGPIPELQAPWYPEEIRVAPGNARHALGRQSNWG